MQQTPKACDNDEPGATVFRILIAAALFVALAPIARAQDAETEKAIEKYRAMLREDPWSNPALLDADRGEALWTAPAGPKKATLETCDLGKGPGKVEGAFAELPRWFADAGRVMDVAKLAVPHEQAAVALGENLFYRRSGPFDFACATCHSRSGLRIRLQGLPFLADKQEASHVIGEWPAYRVSTTHVMTMQ